MNATEKYIKKAVQEAKKELGGNVFKDIHVEMYLTADGATQCLASALLAQAEANEANSEAMLQLAKSLKPIDACAFKITSDGIDLAGCNIKS